MELNEPVAGEAGVDDGVVTVEAQRTGDLSFKRAAILRRRELPCRIRYIALRPRRMQAKCLRVVGAPRLAMCLDVRWGGTDDVAYDADPADHQPQVSRLPDTHDRIQSCVDQIRQSIVKGRVYPQAGVLPGQRPERGHNLQTAERGWKLDPQDACGRARALRIDRSASSNSANTLSHV